MKEEGGLQEKEGRDKSDRMARLTVKAALHNAPSSETSGRRFSLVETGTIRSNTRAAYARKDAWLFSWFCRAFRLPGSPARFNPEPTTLVPTGGTIDAWQIMSVFPMSPAALADARRYRFRTEGRMMGSRVLQKALDALRKQRLRLPLVHVKTGRFSASKLGRLAARPRSARCNT